MEIRKQVLVGIRTRFLATWGRFGLLTAVHDALILVCDNLFRRRFPRAHTASFILPIVLTIFFVVKIDAEPAIFFHIYTEVWEFSLVDANFTLLLLTLIICLADQLIYIASPLPDFIFDLDISHIFIGLGALIARCFLRVFLLLDFEDLLIRHNNLIYTWIKYRLFLFLGLLTSGCDFRWLVAIRVLEARHGILAPNGVEIPILILLIHSNILARFWSNLFQRVISCSQCLVTTSLILTFFLAVFYFGELLLQGLLINFLDTLLLLLLFLLDWLLL